MKKLKISPSLPITGGKILVILGIVALMLYHPMHDSVEDKFTYSLYVLNTKIADYVVR